MRTTRDGKAVALIAVSDLHLSEKPPRFRSNEKDWMQTQIGYLKQVNAMAKEYDAIVVYPGDIFHTVHESAAVINMAMDHIKGYAVPGQHDLPYHRYADIDKSPFWTLVKAGNLTLLEPGKPLEIPFIRLHGFPYGTKVTPLTNRHSLVLEVAVVHAYIWINEHKHAHANDKDSVSVYRKRLKGYDVALFGDNHQGFLVKSSKNCSILNCGGFMRRDSGQLNYQPKVGLITYGGDIVRRNLDISGDVVSEKEVDLPELPEIDVSKVVDKLDKLENKGPDWDKTVHEYMDSGKVSDGVKQALLECLDRRK